MDDLRTTSTKPPDLRRAATVRDRSGDVRTTLIAAAREWFDAGYCVVPTHEDGGKRPFGAWKEYQTTRLPWHDLERLLNTGKHTGIGVLTGTVSGGLEMIEIEGPLDLALKRLAKVTTMARDQYAAIGMDEILQQIAGGCAEKSAGGGVHLFYRVTDGPALGNTKLAHANNKIIAETRGEGGFVVVAPTPGRNGHPDHSTYALLNNTTPQRTANITSEERDLIHLLYSLALDEQPAPVEPHQPQTPTNTNTTGLSALDDYRQQVSWREILEPIGWTYSHHADGRDHWVRPGKTIHEGTSATTIEDGPLYCFSTSVNWPTEQGLSKGHVHALIHNDGDLSATTRQLTREGYGKQSHTNDLTPWEAELDPDATPEERADAETAWVNENLPVLDWHKLWADETTEEWIIEPLLARRRLVALYSAPKVGKSLLMLEIAAAIATGREVIGTTPPAPIRTLYVDFENDPRGDIRERLQAMGYTPNDLDNLQYLSYPNLGKLDTERGARELVAAVKALKCEVVVIDTVSRSIEGDENENDTWLAFYRHTGLALKRAEIALIRLDHSGKDEKRGQRGGSAKSGDVDAVWRMSPSDTADHFDLTCEAQRFPIEHKQITLHRTDQGGTLTHQLINNPHERRHQYLLAELHRLQIDPTLSITNATSLLRAEGITVGKGRIPNRTWDTYKNTPKQFQIPSENRTRGDR